MSVSDGGYRPALRIHGLLEALITRAALVPQGAYQLRDRLWLPPALQRIVAETAIKKQGWSCWTDSSRIWLFTADMSPPSSRDRASVVLAVNVYSERGDLKWAAHWKLDEDGDWRRCTGALST